MIISTKKVCERKNISYKELRKTLKSKKAKRVGKGLYEVDNLSCFGELTARILFSDWHIGKQYDQYPAISKYNEEIARRRVNELIEKIVKLLHDVRPGIKNIVVHSLGDMCEGAGEVYAGQYWQLGIPNAADQAEVAAGLLETALNRFQDEFSVPVYLKMVAGNHEMTKHDNEKNNLAYHTYQLIRWGDKQFNTSFIVDNIGGYTCHSSHGQKYSRSIPKRRSQMMTKREMFNANLVVAGHQHRPDSFRGRNNFAGFLNGSLAGYDQFAQKMSFDPAMVCQTVILTHPEGFIWGEHVFNVE